MKSRIRGRTRRRRGLRALALGAALAMASPLLVACGSSSEIVVNLYNGPQQNLMTIVNRCNDLAHGKYLIKLNELPRAADGQREQLVRRLAAGDSGLDVLDMDITWVPELAEAGWFPRDALPTDVGRYVPPIMAQLNRA